MRFVVDENFPRKIINKLIREGCDVFIPPPTIDDLEIGKIAKRQNRIILTLDKDFANTMIFPSREYPGIIRIRIHPPTPDNIMKPLEELLNKYTQRDFSRRLFVVEEKGVRIIH